MSDQPFLDEHLPQWSQAFESLGEAVTIVDADNNLVFANSAFETLCGYSREELLGKHSSIIFHHTGFEVTTETVRSALRGRWSGEVPIVRKGGEEISTHIVVTLATGQSGEAVGRICVLRELTELNRTGETASRQATEQTILTEIGQVVSSSTDINIVFDHFARDVGKLIPFNSIAIDLRDADNDTFRVASMRGAYVANRVPGAITSLVGTVTDEVRRTSTDVLIQSDNARELVSKFPGQRPEINVGLRSFLSVPLLANDRLIGVLHFRSFMPNAYSASHVALAKSISDQISGSISLRLRLLPSVRPSPSS